MNKKVIVISLISLSILTAGCKSKQSIQPTSNTVDTQISTQTKTNTQNNTKATQKPDDNNTVITPKNTTTIPQKTTPVVKVKNPTKVVVENYNNISKRTKDYIINGQDDVVYFDKLKWNPEILNQVNIESLYKQYIANKGNKDNLVEFARYVTMNAPIQSNWKELFEKDLYSKYHQKVVRYEYISENMYQAYIIYNGKEVPYVGVNPRTGDFHG